MKSKTKKEILRLLSQNLSMFRKESFDNFMCPTCMKVLSIKNLNKISEAHIIPKAARGNLKTFLCKDCNSIFGSKQDKWFGEQINIANSPGASVFSTSIKDKFFEIDGKRFTGTWRKELNKEIILDIHANRNSPKDIEYITNKLNSRLSKINFSLPMPILRNQHLIDVGFLTAAYLMWFKLLGYSWVLQDHLEIIRHQIRNPEQEIIESKYLFNTKTTNWKPWIGLLKLLDDVVPVFGLNKHLVVLPPKDRPKYYENLKKFKAEINFSDIKILKFSETIMEIPPIMILFEERLIVYAKPLKNAEKKLQAVLFTKDWDRGKVLARIGKEEFDELRKQDNTKYVKIDIND